MNDRETAYRATSAAATCSGCCRELPVGTRVYAPAPWLVYCEDCARPFLDPKPHPDMA